MTHAQDNWPGRIARAASGCALPAVMLAGLALRLWGITHESAWWDEYSSLVHLNESSLFSFLDSNRIYDPATLPLYYTIEYLWSCIAGTDTLVMRAPSLLLGMAIIPAVYLLGKALFSRGAGLLAAACVALSPIHAFHAQGIRMYVLFTLLAVLSMHTYVRLRQPYGNRWRRRHTLVQFLLSWTHHFAVLIPATQGIAWFFSGRKNWEGMISWGLLSAAAWVPALLYLSSVQYYPQDMVNWIRIPDLAELSADLFADDVIRLGYELYPSDRAWNWLPWDLQFQARAARPIFDYSLIAVLLGSAAWGLWRKRNDRTAAWLLPLWAFGPVLALYAASWVFRPMIAPRYTVHASIALYLLAAAGITSMHGWRRAAFAGLLCVLMLHQDGLMQPGPQRTNYVGAAHEAHDTANPQTDVVIVTSSFEYNILKYNLDFGELPVLHVEGTAFAALLADTIVGTGPAKAWIVHVVPYWAPDPMPDVWTVKLGLETSYRDFPGIQGIRVVRASAPETPADPAARAAALAEMRERIAQQNKQEWPEDLLSQLDVLPGNRAASLLQAACDLCHSVFPDFQDGRCTGAGTSKHE